MPKIEQLDEGKKLKVTTEQGEIFEGDPLEVTQKLAEAKEHANVMIRDYKAKEAAAPPPAPPAAPVPEPSQEIINARKWMTNEIAQDLGFKSREEFLEFVPKLNQTISYANNASIRDAVLQFKATRPEFSDKEAEAALINDYMVKNGIPSTPEGMTIVHDHFLIESQRNPQFKYETNEEWSQRMAAANQSNRPVPPPVLRSGSPDANLPPDINTMTADQVRAAYFKQLEAERR